MLGQSIDEDNNNDIEYPYDPFSDLAPITSSGGGNDKNHDIDDFVIAIPMSAVYQPASHLAPATASRMRVKSQFERDKYYAKNEDTKYSVTRQATPVGEVEPVISLSQTQQLSTLPFQPLITSKLFLVNIN